MASRIRWRVVRYVRWMRIHIRMLPHASPRARSCPRSSKSEKPPGGEVGTVPWALRQSHASRYMRAECPCVDTAVLHDRTAPSRCPCVRHFAIGVFIKCGSLRGAHGRLRDGATCGSLAIRTMSHRRAHARHPTILVALRPLAVQTSLAVVNPTPVGRSRGRARIDLPARGRVVPSHACFIIRRTFSRRPRQGRRRNSPVVASAAPIRRSDPAAGDGCNLKGIGSHRDVVGPTRRTHVRAGLQLGACHPSRAAPASLKTLRLHLVIPLLKNWWGNSQFLNSTQAKTCENWLNFFSPLQRSAKAPRGRGAQATWRMRRPSSDHASRASLIASGDVRSDPAGAWMVSKRPRGRKPRAWLPA
jgi:hypothetical protein